MAPLLPTQITRKAAEPAPRNANEAQIARARAGMAQADRLWSQPRQTQKTEASAAQVRTSHLSGLGVSTMKTVEPTKAAKATIAGLPASVEKIADRLSDDSAKLLGAVVKRHEETGEAVSFDVVEASKLLGSTVERARAVRESLLTQGLLIMRTDRSGLRIMYEPRLPA